MLVADAHGALVDAFDGHDAPAGRDGFEAGLEPVAQRQEAAEIYTQMVQANPALFPIAGDLIMRSLDLPYADKMAERMKTLLPPAIQEMEASKKPVPPEVQAAMQQAEQAMAMAQQGADVAQKLASSPLGDNNALSNIIQRMQGAPAVAPGVPA